MIGIDTGGTFTDFVVLEPDAEPRIHKVPSTPGNPARAVLSGLRELLAERTDEAAADPRIVHGSTVATNALLERKGAR
ncbi:MAG: hydantoinase/oxoprolinase N-terminal domain-containing protein, partial [Gemmatimonadota bacterium]